MFVFESCRRVLGIMGLPHETEGCGEEEVRAVGAGGGSQLRSGEAEINMIVALMSLASGPEAERMDEGGREQRSNGLGKVGVSDCQRQTDTQVEIKRREDGDKFTGVLHVSGLLCVNSCTNIEILNPHNQHRSYEVIRIHYKYCMLGKSILPITR